MSTATEEIIRVCEALPPEKQTEVADFARFLSASRTTSAGSSCWPTLSRGRNWKPFSVNPPPSLTNRSTRNACEIARPAQLLARLQFFARMQLWECAWRRFSQAFVFVLAIAVVATPGAKASEARLSLSDLQCQYLQNPLGVDKPHPQLSWLVRSGRQGVRQAAYQVLVATSPELLAKDRGDLWDSGRVQSSDSAHVAYCGAALTSRLRCCWKARVWDGSGHRSAWSPPASWEMGLLRPGDWQARWIGSGPPEEPRPAEGFFTSTNQLTNFTQQVKVDGRSTLLRKKFVLRGPVRQARLYVTGLGYYEASCNGSRIGDRVLAPAKTNYRRWVLYDTYDLTSSLAPGTNVLGIMLGNGWLNPYPKWWEPYRMQWFGSKRALAQLHVQYADGSTEIVASDGSWKTAPGPVLFSCIYDGETYDAQQESPGWDQPQADDANWAPANIVEPPGGVLMSHLMPPIKVTEHLPAVAVNHPKPGVQVFDFGQNASRLVAPDRHRPARLAHPPALCGGCPARRRPRCDQQRARRRHRYLCAQR